MDTKLRNQIASIIDDVADMTLATVRPDGFPQATTVGHFNEGLTIYFMTSADAQKAHNISHSNKVSLTINRRYDNWDEIEGLSMAAVAERVTDPEEIERLAGLMLAKFPQAAQYENAFEGEFAVFRLTPTVVSLLDYSKGFGHAVQVTV